MTAMSPPHEICACISFVVMNRFGRINLKLKANLNSSCHVVCNLWCKTCLPVTNMVLILVIKISKLLGRIMKLVEDDAEIAMFPLWDPAIDNVSVLNNLNDI